MIQLRTKSLSIGYDYRPVLKNINIEINYGDFICITGENGAGKSTLIKTLIGLYQPLSGKIIFDKDTKQSDIGYLSQRVDIQNDFPATVWEVVLSGCLPYLKHKLFHSLRTKKITIDKLRLLGIYDIRKQSIKELSGGQLQRVLIARALCAAQKILILDEPFSALDKNVIVDLEDIISKINKELGITIIMITHNMEYSINDCNKIFELSDKNYKVYSKEEYKVRG